MPKDTCASMFISALFTIAKTWKQPKCPSMMNRLRKCSTYTQWNTTQIQKKNDKLMPFAATWMELEILILYKVSQKEKDKHHMISLICGI